MLLFRRRKKSMELPKRDVMATEVHVKGITRPLAQRIEAEQRITLQSSQAEEAGEKRLDADLCEGRNPSDCDCAFS